MPLPFCNIISGLRQQAESLARKNRDVAPLVEKAFLAFYDKQSLSDTSNFDMRNYVGTGKSEVDETITALASGYLTTMPLDTVSPFTTTFAGKKYNVTQDIINRARNMRSNYDRVAFIAEEVNKELTNSGRDSAFLMRGRKENYINNEFREDVNRMIYNVLDIGEATAIESGQQKLKRSPKMIGQLMKPIAKNVLIFDEFVDGLLKAAKIMNYTTGRFEPAFNSRDDVIKALDIAANKQLSLDESHNAIRSNNVTNPRRFGSLEFSRRIEYPGEEGWAFKKRYMITNPVVLGEKYFDYAYSRIFTVKELGRDMKEFEAINISPLLNKGAITETQANFLRDFGSFFIEKDKPSNRLLAQIGKDWRSWVAASVISPKTAIQQPSELIKLGVVLGFHPSYWMPFLDSIINTGRDYITQNHAYGSYYDLVSKSTLHGIDVAFKEGIGTNFIEDISNVAIKYTGVGILDKMTRMTGSMLGIGLTKKYARDYAMTNNQQLKDELYKNLKWGSRLSDSEIELLGKDVSSLTPEELELRDRALTKAGTVWQHKLFHSYQDFELPRWWSGSIEIKGRPVESQILEEAKRSSVQLSKFQWMEGQWIADQYRTQIELHGRERGIIEATGIVLAKSLLAAWLAPVFLKMFSFFNQDNERERELYERKWQTGDWRTGFGATNIPEQIEKRRVDFLFDLFRYNMTTGGLGRTGDTITRFFIEPERFASRNILGIGGFVGTQYIEAVRDALFEGDVTKLKRTAIERTPLQSLNRIIFPVERYAPRESDLRNKPEILKVIDSIKSDMSQIKRLEKELSAIDNYDIEESAKRDLRRKTLARIAKFKRQLSGKEIRLRNMKEN